MINEINSSVYAIRNAKAKEKPPELFVVVGFSGSDLMFWFDIVIDICSGQVVVDTFK
ncbi:MAG: hypothetical protein ACI9PZ_003266 [Parvicella sp.]